MTNNLCLSQQLHVNGDWKPPVALEVNAVLLAAAQNNDGRLEVIYTNSATQIMHCYQNANGTWSGGISFGGTAQQVTLTKDKLGRLTLIYVGSNNTIWSNWQPSAGAITSAWPGTNFGTAQAKQIAVNTNEDGSLVMLLIGLDNWIYWTAQSPTNQIWSPITKTPWAAKQITLAKNQDGRLEFFYVGTNDQIYHGWQTTKNVNTWSEGPLSGSAKSLIAGNTSDGAITLFYIGMDNNIYHNSQTAPNSLSWGGDIRAFQGVYYQGPASVIGLARNQDGRLQLYWVGNDGYSYGTWQNTLNGPYVGGFRGSVATAFSSVTDANGLISLFYVGSADAPPLPATITANYDPIVLTGPQGGNAEVVMRQDGSWTFLGHIHHSEAPPTASHVAVAFAFKDAANTVYVFKRNGAAVVGVGDDNWNNSGSNAVISQNWGSLTASCGWSAEPNTDGDSNGAENQALANLGAPLGPITVVFQA